MVTASHNPKQDNGFKVYWSNGAQIIPPHDKGIAARILSHGLVPKVWSTTLPDTHPSCVDDTETLIDAYFASWIPRLNSLKPVSAPPNLSYTYTAMHGVGYNYVERIVKEMGFPPVIPIPSQQDPDPDFPTVPFPNRSYTFTHSVYTLSHRRKQTNPLLFYFYYYLFSGRKRSTGSRQILLIHIHQPTTAAHPRQRPRRRPVRRSRIQPVHEHIHLLHRRPTRPLAKLIRPLSARFFFVVVGIVIGEPQTGSSRFDRLF
jgi:hypothetical protein